MPRDIVKTRETVDTLSRQMDRAFPCTTVMVIGFSGHLCLGLPIQGDYNEERAPGGSSHDGETAEGDHGRKGLTKWVICGHHSNPAVTGGELDTHLNLTRERWPVRYGLLLLPPKGSPLKACSS
ncbi:hypothetical protein AGOR_G00237600 [Albula goreensis]|uniref:Uncharacterized protein n=1 Tax=Albula goreensis TaxID=1534307 RepID=A0A8T3CF98_9TELE|nr:hypothetical protein AGOR_G00237600 [Albula goreensis]